MWPFGGAVGLPEQCPDAYPRSPELEETRWTGRPGYPIRSMVGCALCVKTLYTIPTWTKTADLVAEHPELQRVLGCEGKPPSLACLPLRYEAAQQRRQAQPLHRRGAGFAGLRASSRSTGRDIAIDASDLPAYANGMRLRARADHDREDGLYRPGASWGHRSAVSTRKGGGYYGYRLHAAVCSRTGLPIAWKSRRPGTTRRASRRPAETASPATASNLHGSDGQGLRHSRVYDEWRTASPPGDPAATDAVM